MAELTPYKERKVAGLRALTVWLPMKLYRRLKVRAADDEVSMMKVIEAALERYLK